MHLFSFKVIICNRYIYVKQLVLFIVIHKQPEVASLQKNKTMMTIMILEGKYRVKARSVDFTDL